VYVFCKDAFFEILVRKPDGADKLPNKVGCAAWAAVAADVRRRGERAVLWLGNCESFHQNKKATHAECRE
jgi:hypothetical protein